MSFAGSTMVDGSAVSSSLRHSLRRRAAAAASPARPRSAPHLDLSCRSPLDLAFLTAAAVSFNRRGPWRACSSHGDWALDRDAIVLARAADASVGCVAAAGARARATSTRRTRRPTFEVHDIWRSIASIDCTWLERLLLARAPVRACGGMLTVRRMAPAGQDQDRAHDRWMQDPHRQGQGLLLDPWLGDRSPTDQATVAVGALLWRSCSSCRDRDHHDDNNDDNHTHEACTSRCSNNYNHHKYDHSVR